MGGAEPRGSPLSRSPRDQRTASTYIFGAVCPKQGKGAALILPTCNTEAMNLHLVEIAATVAPGAHAVLLVDQAGWHLSTELVVPPNITIMALPPKCPELNPVENVWQFLRDNWLSNRARRWRICDSLLYFALLSRLLKTNRRYVTGRVKARKAAEMAARRGRPPVPPPARLEQRPAQRVFLGTAAPRLLSTRKSTRKPAGSSRVEARPPRRASRYSGPQEISVAAEKVAARQLSGKVLIAAWSKMCHCVREDCWLEQR